MKTKKCNIVVMYMLEQYIDGKPMKKALFQLNEIMLFLRLEVFLSNYKN